MSKEFSIPQECPIAEHCRSLLKSRGVPFKTKVGIDVWKEAAHAWGENEDRVKACMLGNDMCEMLPVLEQSVVMTSEYICKLQDRTQHFSSLRISIR